MWSYCVHFLALHMLLILGSTWKLSHLLNNRELHRLSIKVTKSKLKRYNNSKKSWSISSFSLTFTWTLPIVFIDEPKWYVYLSTCWIPANHNTYHLLVCILNYKPCHTPLECGCPIKIDLWACNKAHIPLPIASLLILPGTLERAPHSSFSFYKGGYI